MYHNQESASAINERKASGEQPSTIKLDENNYESDWDAETDQSDKPDVVVSLLLPEKAKMKMLEKSKGLETVSSNSSLENLIAHILD
jgi:hypothetical protein